MSFKKILGLHHKSWSIGVPTDIHFRPPPFIQLGWKVRISSQPDSESSILRHEVTLSRKVLWLGLCWDACGQCGLTVENYWVLNGQKWNQVSRSFRVLLTPRTTWSWLHHLVGKGWDNFWDRGMKLYFPRSWPHGDRCLVCPDYLNKGLLGGQQSLVTQPPFSVAHETSEKESSTLAWKSLIIFSKDV